MRKCEKSNVPAWQSEAEKIVKEKMTIGAENTDGLTQFVELIVRKTQQAEEKKSRSAADAQRIKLAKELLENYNKIKNAISAGISSTVDVLDDTEFQRLMQREDSVKNQQVRSLAMKSATNRVLFLQINSALDEMKNVCRNDPNPRFRRQYDVLYSRYIRGWHVEAICTELRIEQAEYYRTVRNALGTFSLILFGGILPECLIHEQSILSINEDCRGSVENEQMRFF